MEKERTDHNAAQSGVALVMALLITVVMLLMIVSLSILYQTGYQSNTINKDFSNVYDAAHAGVEHSSGVVNSFLKGRTAANIGDIGNVLPDKATLANIVTSCTDTAPATIKAKSADGKFVIESAIDCLGTKPVPGYGGALRFPPPAGKVASGTGGLTTKYLYFSESAKAQETSNPENIGKTEAIYRALQ